MKKGLCFLCVLCAFGVVRADDRQPVRGDTAKPATERLQALEQEAKDLASREKTLLAQLRKLEVERQIRSEELVVIRQQLDATEQALAETTARQAELRAAADASRPEIEQRLVRLYKMGRAGHWRLLLDIEDARAVGRAYRMASALTRLDRESVSRHAARLTALETERAALEQRAREVAGLQQRAVAARAAADRALASHEALLRSVAARQDLATQLAAELRGAQEKLDSAVTNVGAAGTTLPLHTFKGELPWPANGIVIGRFGRHRGPNGTTLARNGIEVSLAEGRPVAAVHDGVITHAAPFAGYGQLVIIAHGADAYSLYGHLAGVSVIKGDRIAAGARLGRSGRNLAGNPALYFELRIDGKPVDPLQWLRRQP